MLTRNEKKELLRKDIVEAAAVYSRQLAGRVFLYVVGDQYFEVSFRTDCFRHLTGVLTDLSAGSFYRKAYSGKLAGNQFYFDNTHPYRTACRKASCLKRLPELTTTFVCVLHNMHTLTFVYTLGVTNLEFTLGLTEAESSTGKRFFLPRTLRVDDHSVERSENPDDDIVDFIFRKSAAESIYKDLLVADHSKAVPLQVRHLIDASFYGETE